MYLKYSEEINKLFTKVEELKKLKELEVEEKFIPNTGLVKYIKLNDFTILTIKDNNLINIQSTIDMVKKYVGISIKETNINGTEKDGMICTIILDVPIAQPTT